MRVNLYAEEITSEVESVSVAIKETGNSYYGVRFYLHSSDKLHHTDKDDDRSAVTFWASSKVLRELFTKALNEVSEA